MSATILVKTPWQFGDRSVKECINNGVVLPKLKVEHPMSRLGDPDQLNLSGISRLSERLSRSSKEGSQSRMSNEGSQSRMSNEGSQSRISNEGSQSRISNEGSHSRMSNLPGIPDSIEVKIAEDRSKVHIPVFGNHPDLSNRIESRLTSTSIRSVDSNGNYKDRLSTAQLEKKIREKVKTGYFSMKNLFQSYDPESRGKVNREQLIRVLCVFLAMKISLSQFNRLMKRLGLENSKVVTLEEFYQIFKTKKESESEYPLWFFHEKVSEEKCTCIKVHTYLKLQAAKDLEKLLSSLNIMKEENIIKPEFHTNLKGIGYELQPIEFEKLWRKYDDSNIGVLEVNKFIDKITGKKKSIQLHGNDSNENNENLIREQSISIEKWLTKKFREGFHEMQHAFKEVESDGMVSRQKFIKVLEDYGLFLKDNQLDMFMQRCGVPTAGNRIEYKQFLTMFQNRGEKGMTNKVLGDHQHRYHHHNELENQSVVTDTSEIEALLVDMFQGEFLKLMNKFQNIDNSGKGTISTIEFRAVLESFFGVKILEPHFAQLLKTVAVDSKGRVIYQEFLSKFDSKSSKSIFDFASSTVDQEYDDFARIATRLSSTSRQSGDLSTSRHPTGNVTARTVQQLTAVIKETLRNNFESIEKSFHEMDEKNTKRMNEDIMHKMLNRAGLNISSTETEALWKHLITDQRGALEFSQFIRHFGYSLKSAAFPNSKSNPPMRGDSDFNRRSNRFNSSKELVEDYVKNLMEKKFSEIWKTFLSIDKANTGYIDNVDFKRLLYEQCEDLSSHELTTLAEKYSVFGRVAWKEFMKKLCPHPHRILSRTGNDMNNLISHSQMENLPINEIPVGCTPLMSPRLREKIKSGRWKEIRSAFKLRDETNKGFLTVDEFKDVLKSCNIVLDSNDMYRVLSVLDEQLEGKIQYINLCKLVPSNYST